MAIGAESAVTNGVVKSFFGRVRPREYDELAFHHGLRRPLTSSFPSGHATAAFTAAVFLSDHDDALAPVWYGLAGMVAFSRLYVRMHHASDVIAGAAFGLVLGRVLRRVVGPR
jgi:undecaprenyl-diphosphatase